MRNAVKAICRGTALVLVLPAIVSYSIRRLLLGSDRALEGSTQLLSLIPGIAGQYLRRAFLAQTLAGCDPTSVVSFGTIFSKSGARLDERVYVGPGCYLGLVHIECDVLIGSGVHVTSGRHTHGTGSASVPIRDQEGELTQITIGAGAWVGSGAIIMADIGANSVIGAGAVVVDPVPPSVVAVGVPAKVIRQRA